MSVIDIERTILYENGHQNTLRVSERMYDNPAILRRIKKHSNKLYYYECIDCLQYPTLRMADAVNHKLHSKKTVCGFCKLQCVTESQVNRFIYDRLVADGLPAHDILMTQVGFKYQRRRHRADMFLNFDDRKYMIEVDDKGHYVINSHQYLSDRRKVRYCRENGIILLRINAPSNELIPETVLQEVYDCIINNTVNEWKCFNDPLHRMDEFILSVYNAV